MRAKKYFSIIRSHNVGFRFKKKSFLKTSSFRLSASFNGVNVADDENDEDDEFFKDDEEYKPFEESYYKIQLIQKKFQTNL